MVPAQARPAWRVTWAALSILKALPWPSEQGLQQGEISARAKAAWLGYASTAAMWDPSILGLHLGNANKAASEPHTRSWHHGWEAEVPFSLLGSIPRGQWHLAGALPDPLSPAALQKAHSRVWVYGVKSVGLSEQLRRGKAELWNSWCAPRAQGHRSLVLPWAGQNIPLRKMMGNHCLALHCLDLVWIWRICWDRIKLPNNFCPLYTEIRRLWKVKPTQGSDLLELHILFGESYLSSPFRLEPSLRLHQGFVIISECSAFEDSLLHEVLERSNSQQFYSKAVFPISINVIRERGMCAGA